MPCDWIIELLQEMKALIDWSIQIDLEHFFSYDIHCPASSIKAFLLSSAVLYLLCYFIFVIENTCVYPLNTNVTEQTQFMCWDYLQVFCYKNHLFIMILRIMFSESQCQQLKLQNRVDISNDLLGSTNFSNEDQASIEQSKGQ